MFRRVGSATPLSALVVSEIGATQMRFKGQKAKKRPKPSKKYIEDVQVYRDEWQRDNQRLLADSLRGHVEFSLARRMEPWDDRYAPFDRQEKDGVHLIINTFMDEKLQLCGYHPRPTKRLFANVGLLGPTVTTKARWKPVAAAALPYGSKVMERHLKRDWSLRNCGFND